MVTLDSETDVQKYEKPENVTDMTPFEEWYGKNAGSLAPFESSLGGKDKLEEWYHSVINSGDAWLTGDDYYEKKPFTKEQYLEKAKMWGSYRGAYEDPNANFYFPDRTLQTDLDYQMLKEYIDGKMHGIFGVGDIVNDKQRYDDYVNKGRLASGSRMDIGGTTRNRKMMADHIKLGYYKVKAWEAKNRVERVRAEKELRRKKAQTKWTAEKGHQQRRRTGIRSLTINDDKNYGGLGIPR